MKQLLLLLLTIVCAAGITVAQPAPPVLGSPYANVIPGVDAKYYLKAPTVDSLTLNGRPDSAGAMAYLRSDKSLYVYQGGGVWAKVGSGSGGGTTINNFSNGLAAFTDTFIYVATGAKNVIPIYTGGKTVSSIRVYDPVGNPVANGSDFLPQSGTVGDTTYVYYALTPTGQIHFIFSGTLKPLDETGLNAVALDSSSIAITWRDIEHETAYELQFSYDSVNWGVEAILAPDVTTYTDTGLVANQRYYYRIRAQADSIHFLYGNFSYGSAVTAALPKLTKPSPLTATASHDTITATWTASAGAVNYTLQLYFNGTWVTQTTTTATSHTIVGLNYNTEYLLRVNANADYIDNSNSDFDSTEVTTGAPATSQLAASAIQATAVSPNEIDLTVQTPSNATGTVLLLLDGSDWVVLDTISKDVIIYPHQGLNDTTKYVYQAYAYSTDSSYTRSVSVYDSAITFQTPPPDTATLPTPVIHVTVGSTTQLNIALDSNSNAIAEVVERTLNGITWVRVGTFTPTLQTVQDTGLLPGTKYKYRAYFEGDDSLYKRSLYGYDSATTTAVTQLTAPSPLTAANINSTSNTITLTNVSNESGYEFQYSLNKQTWTVFKTTAANTVSATHSSLTPNTKYYYRGRAISTNPLYSTSGYTNIDSATTASGAVTLETPAPSASAIDTVSIAITWQDVTGENNYKIWYSSDTSNWILLATVAANVTSTIHSGLPTGSTWNYKIQAIGNGTTTLSSGFGYASATTLTSTYITKFGILTDNGNSPYTQNELAQRTTDSISQCRIRISFTAKNNNASPIDNLLATEKEATVNIFNRPVDTGYNFTSNEERAKFVAQADTFIRRHLVGKNDTLIVVSNEENNVVYRHIDTSAGVNNSAYRYYYNEYKVVDSLLRVIGGGQFKATNGGITGKGALWLVSKNLRDSGLVAEAQEFEYAVFTLAERKTLPTWDIKSPQTVSITTIRQLLSYYRADTAMKLLNVHIKMPLNGVDSAHINPRVIGYIMRAYKNLSGGKDVICNELGSKSVSPAIMAELLQACATYKMKYAIAYSGTSQTTTPLPTGKDVNWWNADYSALSPVGIAALLTLLTIFSN